MRIMIQPPGRHVIIILACVIFSLLSVFLLPPHLAAILLYSTLRLSTCMAQQQQQPRPVVRTSKFRNVFGTAWKKDQCYTNIKVSKSAWDSTFCAVNPKFLAVIIESAGGGAFVVIPLSKTGKVKGDYPVVSGHKGPVLDIAWCLHNDNIIASGSEDCSVKIWEIPEDGLTKTLTEPMKVLLFHQKRVGTVLWHPTARNVLLTAGADNFVVIWDVGTGNSNIIIDRHPDTIYSVCWNWDGSKIVTACKDKKVRILSPRTGHIDEEAICHEGSKACRAVFLKNGMVFTTGFSKSSERQYSLREPSRLSEPLAMAEIDNSNGVLFPMVDADTNMIYVCGKGDSVIRYFEVSSEAPYVHYINTFQLPDAQRAIGMLPKRGCDVTTCEIARFYRLNSSGYCQVISMTVPRKSELFQEDLYPPTVSLSPAISAEEWFSGIDQSPVLMSMKTGSQVMVLNEDPFFESRTLRRSVSFHAVDDKTLALPVDTVSVAETRALSSEMVELKSLLTSLEERIRALEDLNQEERLQRLEALFSDQCLPKSASLFATTPFSEPRRPALLSGDFHESTPAEYYKSAVTALSTFLASPSISSLSALGTQLSSPLSAACSLALPVFTPLKVLSSIGRWVPPPIRNISSFSSALIASLSPVTRPPRRLPSDLKSD